MVRCANCGNYPAAFRIGVQLGETPDESTVVCPECAEKIQRQALGPVGALAPFDLLTRLLNDPEDSGFLCPVCGYDVENLVRLGKLGCRQCYATFADEVLNLVRRAIGRDTHYGKTPPERPESPPEGE